MSDAKLVLGLMHRQTMGSMDWNSIVWRETNSTMNQGVVGNLATITLCIAQPQTHFLSNKVIFGYYHNWIFCNDTRACSLTLAGYLIVLHILLEC